MIISILLMILVILQIIVLCHLLYTNHQRYKEDKKFWKQMDKIIEEEIKRYNLQEHYNEYKDPSL